jgi:hypothetical protein
MKNYFKNPNMWNSISLIQRETFENKCGWYEMKLTNIPQNIKCRMYDVDNLKTLAEFDTINFSKMVHVEKPIDIELMYMEQGKVDYSDQEGISVEMIRVVENLDNVM